MGFISNVLEYGFTAGSIITKAENDANRICKGIKTTIIEDEGEKDEEHNLNKSEEEGDEEDYNFKIIFHPEWLPKEMQERLERMNHLEEPNEEDDRQYTDETECEEEKNLEN